MDCRHTAGRSLPQCHCLSYRYHKWPQRYSSCSPRPLDKRSVTDFPFPLTDTAVLRLKASRLKPHAWRQGPWRIKFRSGSDSRNTNNKTRLRNISCSLPLAIHLPSPCKYFWKPLHIRFSNIMVSPLNYIHNICCQKGSFWFCLSSIIQNLMEFFPSLTFTSAFAVVIALSAAPPVATARSGALW